MIVRLSQEYFRVPYLGKRQGKAQIKVFIIYSQQGNFKNIGFKWTKRRRNPFRQIIILAGSIFGGKYFWREKYWREIFLAVNILAGFSWFSFWICFCFPILNLILTQLLREAVHIRGYFLKLIWLFYNYSLTYKEMPFSGLLAFPRIEWQRQIILKLD